MEKNNKLDFGGQHIYVGMDVHKKSWSVSIHTEEIRGQNGFYPSPDFPVLFRPQICIKVIILYQK
jgi:hypothetical protein